MQNVGRLPRPVCENRPRTAGGCFRELPRPVHGAVRVGSGALLHVTRPELGRAHEKDRSRAGAPDGHRNVTFRSKGNARRSFDGEQEICEGKQPVD